MIGAGCVRRCRQVITKEELKIIIKKLCQAASTGFVVDNDQFSCDLSRIASDGIAVFQNSVPISDAIQAYHARSGEIAYKKIGNKEQAKLSAQTFEHIEPLFKQVERDEMLHKEILDNPCCIWNMNKTSLDATEGKLKRAFTCSSSENGGSRGFKSILGQLYT